MGLDEPGFKKLVERNGFGPYPDTIFRPVQGQTTDSGTKVTLKTWSGEKAQTDSTYSLQYDDNDYTPPPSKELTGILIGVLPFPVTDKRKKVQVLNLCKCAEIDLRPDGTCTVSLIPGCPAIWQTSKDGLLTVTEIADADKHMIMQFRVSANKRMIYMIAPQKNKVPWVREL
ncbi:MAG TPA: hypothetical protein VGL56_14705 [Fimbriimonadaceae bacterium]|jgi:hypothetical protein